MEDNEDHNDEEEKGTPTEIMNDMTSATTNANEETKQSHKDSKADHDTDDEDTDEDEKDELFDLNVTMDLLKTPLRKVDEFEIFHKVMQTLHNKDPQYINNLVG